jgi:uncharacterized protein YecT (DUF1311 family)
MEATPAVIRIPCMTMLFLLICSATAAAQQDASNPCTDESTTYAMGQCVGAQLLVADSTLALYYETALRRAAAPAELRQAQAQWKRFRDADCHAIGAQYQGGSLAPIAQGQCQVDLANDRTHELWSIYLRITEDPLPEPGVRE